MSAQSKSCAQSRFSRKYNAERLTGANRILLTLSISLLTAILPTALYAAGNPQPMGQITGSISVKSPEGWILETDTIEVVESLDGNTKRYRSERDAFIVFVVELTNLTDANGCVVGNNLALIGDFEPIGMEKEHLKIVKDQYGVDYPGNWLGICVDYDDTEPAVLVFDAPAGEYLSLEFRDATEEIGTLTQVDDEFMLDTTMVKPTQTPVPTVSPTTTNTPTISPTPSPTPVLVDAQIVTPGWMRFGAGVGYEPSEEFEAGAQVVLVGIDENKEWYETLTGEWLPVANVESFTTTLPIVTMTPTPTDTATPVPPTATSTATLTPLPTDTTTPSPTPNLVDRLEDAVGNNNRELDRISKAEQVADVISIQWAIDRGFGDEQTKRNAKTEAVKILQAIYWFGLDYRLINLEGTFSMIDAYGNTEEMTVVWLTYAHDDVERINWTDEDFIEYLFYKNVYSIANHIKLHPAFQDE